MNCPLQTTSPPSQYTFAFNPATHGSTWLKSSLNLFSSFVTETLISSTGCRQSPWTNFKILFNECLNTYMQ